MRGKDLTAKKIRFRFDHPGNGKCRSVCRGGILKRTVKRKRDRYDSYQGRYFKEAGEQWVFEAEQENTDHHAGKTW